MSDQNNYLDLSKRKLKGRPISEWMLYYTPTERHVLWIVANCKEAYSPWHFPKYYLPKDREEEERLRKEHPIPLALQLLQDMKARGYVKSSRDGYWHVTLWGQIHRLSINPSAGFIIAFLSLVFGMGIVKFGCNEKEDGTKEGTTHKIPQPMQDSVVVFQPSPVPVSTPPAKQGDSLKMMDTSRQKHL